MNSRNVLPRRQKACVPRIVRHQKSSGQSTVEYLVVLLFGVMVLVMGEDPPIQKLGRALQEYYTDYSYAMSFSTMPNCFIEESKLGVTVKVDKCLDLKDPEWPIDISFDW